MLRAFYYRDTLLLNSTVVFCFTVFFAFAVIKSSVTFILFSHHVVVSHGVKEEVRAGLFKTAEAVNDSKVVVKRSPLRESFLIYARRGSDWWGEGGCFCFFLYPNPVVSQTSQYGWCRKAGGQNFY